MKKLLVLVPGALLSSLGFAGVFTPGNLLLSKWDFNTNLHEVSEFTTSGSVVQTISVPDTGVASISEYMRGLTVDSLGRLHVFNGTFSAGISTYSPTTNSWSNKSIPGLSVVNNGSYGKLAAHGDYLFIPDHQTFNGGELFGIVRYNLLTDTYTRFAVDNPNDVAIDIQSGPGGLIYTLNGNGSPSGRFINAYNPETLALVSSIDLTSVAFTNGGAIRDFHVRSNGDVVLNYLQGPMIRVNSAGVLQQTQTYTAGGFIDDMTVREDGTIAIMNSNGAVKLFNSSFTSLGSFQSNNGSVSSGFGTFVPVPVPEPASLVAVGLGISFLARRRKSRGA